MKAAPKTAPFSSVNLDDLKQQAGRKLNDFLPVPEKKSTYTYAELFQKKDQEQPFLIPDLLPAGTVTILIGEDGIGKTQICTQLCLHCAFGYDAWLGMHLNVTHKRSMIVATEDAKEKWIKAAVKQATALDPGHDPQALCVDFMEASDFDAFDDFKKELEDNLKKHPYDVVVIDALSDIFTMIDGEVNSNKDARKILSFFQHMANAYATTILILHHASKTKIVAKRNEGKLFIEKNDAQGAGAITQKARTVLALTHDPSSVTENGQAYKNYLHVVKANLMGKHYMTNAVELEFQGTTLLHRPTGLVDIFLMQQSALNGPGTAQKDEPAVSSQLRKLTAKEIPDTEHLLRLRDVFHDGPQDRDTLLKRLSASYGVGKTKLEEKGGYMQYLQEMGWIVKVGKLFHFTGAGSEGDGELPFSTE